MKSLGVGLILLVCCSAAAQDFARNEVFGGYSYASVDNGSTGKSISRKGWIGSFATNLNRWIALESSTGAQYNQQTLILQTGSYPLSSWSYSLLAGPRFAFRTQRITPFVHGLFGIERTLAFGKYTYNASNNTVFVPYENGFSAALGGGFDIGMSRRVTLRTQGDYFITQPGGGGFTFGKQNNFRAAAGIVFTFGRAWEQSAGPVAHPREAPDSRAVLPSPVIMPPNPAVDSETTASHNAASAVTVAPPTMNVSSGNISAPQPPVLQSPSSSSPVPSYGGPSSTKAVQVKTTAAAPAITTTIAPKPAPAPVPAPSQITTTPVTPAPQDARSGFAKPMTQIPSMYAAPSQTGDSLGEVARRYRAQKKKQKPE